MTSPIIYIDIDNERIEDRNDLRANHYFIRGKAKIETYIILQVTFMHDEREWNTLLLNIQRVCVATQRNLNAINFNHGKIRLPQNSVKT